MHCSKCVSFWGTSYSRPPTHTSLPSLLLTSPRYKILAAPLPTTTHESQRAHHERRQNYFLPEYIGSLHLSATKFSHLSQRPNVWSET